MRNIMRVLFPIVFIFSLYGCTAPNYTARIDQSHNFLSNRQFETAQIEIMKLIREFPEKPEPHYLLGLMNFKTGKYSECLQNFNEAEYRGIDKTPEFYFNRGIAFYHTGNLINAEKDFRILVNFESDTNMLKYIGLIRYDLGDYPGSIAAYRKASSLENDANSLYTFGLALYNQGMNSESLNAFMMAYNLSPNNEDIIFQTANLLMLNGRNDEAVSIYSKIPFDSDYYSQSIYNQAEAYIKAENYQKAVELLENYTSARPDDYEALYNLSSALIKAGEYVSATDILMELIDFEKYQLIAAYNLGIANYKLGKYAESIFYLSQVTEDDPDNISYKYAYGLALSEHGDTEEAKMQMEEVIYLNPENADAKEWLKRHQTPEISTE